MGQPKLTPLAAAIRAAEQLSDEEKQTLRDVLRPAPKPRSKPKPERKPSQKRKAGKEATATSGNDGDDGMKCHKCGSFFDENVHHLTNRPDYHVFEPAGEASKGVGA